MFTKYIKNFLTKDECQTIISLGNSINLIEMKSSLFVNGKLINENINYKGNKRLGGYFTNDLLDNQLVKDITKRIIDLINNIKPFNNIIYNGIPKYSFNRYEDGDFLDWHSDNHEILSGATATVIIQLNEDYEGGDVKYSINDEEFSVEKSRGSVFIFDSNISHSVLEVADGYRYSINVWPSKEIKQSII